MFRHVVLFKWAEGHGADHVKAVGAALDELPRRVPVIRGYHHGPDAGINDGTFDFAIVAEFDSAEDYLVYRDHPDHQAFIRDHIVGKVADRSAVQFDDRG